MRFTQLRPSLAGITHNIREHAQNLNWEEWWRQTKTDAEYEHHHLGDVTSEVEDDELANVGKAIRRPPSMARTITEKSSSVSTSILSAPDRLYIGKTV